MNPDGQHHERHGSLITSRIETITGNRVGRKRKVRSRSPGSLQLEPLPLSVRLLSPRLSKDQMKLLLQRNQEINLSDFHLSDSPVIPASRSPCKHLLAPLEIEHLYRKRVVFDEHGELSYEVDEILSLKELNDTMKEAISPLNLGILPRKCTYQDEVALMPCHSLAYRYLPLRIEQWKEPVRDRYKNWREDELENILSLQMDTDVYKMTNTFRRWTGKWRLWESKKLRLREDKLHKMAFHTSCRSPARKEGQSTLDKEVLLHYQAAMISKTYVIASIYGVGIFGRVFTDGLKEKQTHSRQLRIDAYDPITCRHFGLELTLGDLEFLFQNRMEMLGPGKKRTLLQEIMKLLYFKYPQNECIYRSGDDGNEDGSEILSVRSEPCTQEIESNAGEDTLPILCISIEPRMNEALLRRLERQERLRREEEERLRRLAAFMSLPRRKRNRIICLPLKLQGYRFYISVYNFPMQARSFVVIAYDPLTSTNFHLNVSLADAAKLAFVKTPSHKWNTELKASIASALLPHLHLKGQLAIQNQNAISSDSQDYREYAVALCMKNERKGVVIPWVLPRQPTNEVTQLSQIRLVRRKNEECSARDEFVRKEKRIKSKYSKMRSDLEDRLRELEVEKMELKIRDLELKEIIDEIDSGEHMKEVGMMSQPMADLDTKRKGQMSRKAHKHERKATKATLTLNKTKISALKKEISALNEEERENMEMLKSRFDRSIAAACATVDDSTQSNYCNEVDARTRCTRTHGLNTRNRYLSKAHIRNGQRFISSGTCRLFDSYYRYSIFQVDSMYSCATIVDSNVDQEPFDEGILLSVEFYEGSESRRLHIRLTCLEWILFSKKSHEKQLLIPEFALSMSAEIEKLVEHRHRMAECQTELNKLKSFRPKKTKSKQAQIKTEIQQHLLEQSRIYAKAPWKQVIQEMIQRLSIWSDKGLDIDRTIYESPLSIVSIAEDNSDSTEGNLVECQVSVKFVYPELVFVVQTLKTKGIWEIVHPDSKELAHELSRVTYLEQQVQLETACLSLLFFATESGSIGIRFEE